MKSSLVNKSVLVSTIFAGLIVATTSGSVIAGTPVYIGSRVPTGSRISMDDVDHAPWNGILKQYVDADGFVDYKALKNSSRGLHSLNNYLAKLSSANPNLAASREGKLAFWINAYNSVTVHGILREYPTSSIRNHTARVFGYNIWKDLQLYVGGTPVSLEHIEHQILRPMNEPRIHFAIVCASVGCARLRNEAYVAADIDQQLSSNTLDFFSRSKNFRFDPGSNRFHLSAILKWFGEDFGANQSAQLHRVSAWMPTTAAQHAASGGTARVSYLAYDWNINDQASR